MLACDHHHTRKGEAIVTLSLLRLKGNALSQVFKITLCGECACAFHKSPHEKHIADLRRITKPTHVIVKEFKTQTKRERTPHHGSPPIG